MLQYHRYTSINNLYYITYTTLRVIILTLHLPLVALILITASNAVDLVNTWPIHTYTK